MTLLLVSYIHTVKLSRGAVEDSFIVIIPLEGLGVTTKDTSFLLVVNLSIAVLEHGSGKSRVTFICP
ncbi:hypothetical protein [Plebeiibacterium sediminum]|uniref:Uncharacterized protein n=1 Tax=Plebeiibacterium sediminum TaxID=2992112 RepID=A0AAE3SH42_9BACT|nr:hypothetical protein [Plebeiobacterium sediminum]MCW3788792.1 hypothetical protein [Plebeiobacterium sediminum]